MRFSLIVPTYGRPRHIVDCVRSIAALEYPRHEFELLVVDDGSPQPVEPLLRGSLAADRFSLTVLHQSNAGPAAARNLAAEHAKGELLGFLDDDCQPRTDWLACMDQAARDSPSAMLGGMTKNAVTGNVCAEVNQSLLDWLVSWLLNVRHPLAFFPSNNIVLPRSHFQQLGGFDVSFPRAGAEDREFCSRWLSAGLAMQYVPQAVVDHYHPQSLLNFMEMHFRYGRGASVFHRRQVKPAIRLASPAFYRQMLEHAFRTHSGMRRVAVPVLTAGSQMVSTAGFLYESWQDRER